MKYGIRIALLALLALVLYHPANAQVAIGIRVNFGPPAIPVYDMPLCPGDGYMWSPGYWAWDADDADYYWVPGTWVLAPEPEFFWTPGWWGWDTDAFLWHEGYWGPTIGFYGGVNYGFGYYGRGFVGGRWEGGHFRYNTAVWRVDTTVIHNVYEDRTVITNVDINNHVSYNGGEGGRTERPTPDEERAVQERHVAPIAAQSRQQQAARSNPQMRATANQGRPPVAATARPGEFTGHDVVAAKSAGAPYHPPANRAAPGGTARPAENNSNGAGSTPGHARDLQPHQPAPVPENIDPKVAKKYQQQQQKLIDQQNAEHQQLQQRQAIEDQRAAQQSKAKQQQTEQKHAQQTQQMEQKHTTQAQHMQTRQAPAPRPSRPPK